MALSQASRLRRIPLPPWRLWLLLLIPVLFWLGPALASHQRWAATLGPAALAAADKHQVEIAADGRLEATADDPYFVPVLPFGMGQVSAVKLEIAGLEPPSSDFELYYATSDAPGFSEQRVLLPRITLEKAGAMTLRWQLPDAAERVRIDVPDNARLTLVALELYGAPGLDWKLLCQTVATFLVGYSLAYLALAALGLTSTGFGWPGEGLWTPAVLGGTIFKLWLVSVQTVQAIGGAGHDDRWFLNAAGTLLRGEWLGPYSEMTLIKGQMYSVWIAGGFLAGVPLLLSQQLLYAASCALLVVALAPLVRSRPWLRLIYLLLLFNPFTCDGLQQCRVLRHGVYPAFMLLVLAGAIGICTRPTGPRGRLALWATLLGLALGAFWLTREEGVWIMPAVGALLGAAVWAWWRERPADWRSRLILCCALPFALWGTALFAVSYANWRCYGVFATNEFKSHEFQAAYGALCGVEPLHWRRYVPVQKETRERIYRVSPAFAELRPYLEGENGLSGARDSESVLHQPAEDLEIAGGWFMWSLRGAVASAGYYRDGATAMRYYARLAQEVNDAIRRGDLRGQAGRVSMSPPWQNRYLASLGRAMRSAIVLVTSFDQLRPGVSTSAGSESSFELFRDLTRNALAPTVEPTRVTSFQNELDLRRFRLLGLIIAAYAKTMPFLSPVALAAYLLGGVLCLWRRRGWLLFYVTTVVLGSALTYVLLISLIEVTSYPLISCSYLSPVYPLLLLFVGLSGALLVSLLRPAAAAHPAVLPRLVPSAGRSPSNGAQAEEAEEKTRQHHLRA
ncbi:MAG: hypothetical protein JO295_08920 [Verrucomicrobia bacterium]|nr:hypothetical protein [Verrucomicrobiota bacterium]